MLALLVLLLANTSCDRNIEPYVPGEQPREPDLSRIFPEPEQAPGVAGSPQAEQGSSTAAPPRGAAASVHGLVDVAPSLAQNVRQGGVLFIIARPVGVTAGPPLAVVRIADPEFPIEFEMGQRDVMMQNVRFAGEMELTARLDYDGNATTKLDGDLEGRGPGPVRPGSIDIVVMLDAATTEPRATPTGSGSSSGPVRGRIELSPGLGAERALIGEGNVVFIAARRRGVAGGPPLAAVMLSDPRFPLDFEIGPDNVMIPTMRFEGEMDISVRLDRDGNAMTRHPEDLEARPHATVTPGTEGVVVVLE